MERSLLASCNSFFLPRSNATIRPSLFTVMETCFCHLISDRNAWPRHVSTRAFLASRESLIEKRPRTWSNGNFQINRLRTILCTRSFQKQRSQREKRYNAIDVKHYTLKKKKKPKVFKLFVKKKKIFFPQKQSPQSRSASSTRWSDRKGKEGQKEREGRAANACMEADTRQHWQFLPGVIMIGDGRTKERGRSAIRNERPPAGGTTMMRRNRRNREPTVGRRPSYHRRPIGPRRHTARLFSPPPFVPCTAN